MKDVFNGFMSDYWFKPQPYGWGAQPANWKGWLATLAFIAAIVWETHVLLGGVVGPTQLVTWALVTAVLVGSFTAFARTMTDGDWRWRWGPEDV